MNLTKRKYTKCIQRKMHRTDTKCIRTNTKCIEHLTITKSTGEGQVQSARKKTRTKRTDKDKDRGKPHMTHAMNTNGRDEKKNKMHRTYTKHT